MLDHNRYIHRFNQFAEKNNGLVNKALTSATNVGEAFIPEYLEQIITDSVIRLSPELALITPKDCEGAKVAEYDKLNVRPLPGGAMGESATTPVTQSASSRETVTLKIVRRKGQVTNFLQDASRKFHDTQAWEMQNHLQSQVLDLIYYILYGNAASKTYVNSVAEQTPAVEFNGLDYWISTNRDNQARGGVVPTTLKVLDDMVDASNRVGGAPHQRVYGMSPEMLSLLSRLETTVRKSKDLQGSAFGLVEIPGGWRLATYRDIPIIETTSTSPIETMRPTVTLAAEDTGVGTLSNGTYHIMVAPMTYEGEQLASATQSVTLAGGTSTQRIRIALSTYHKNAAGYANVFAYKIYYGSTNVNHTLIKIVPAYVYDTLLAPTALATDYNGSATSYIWLSTVAADASVPTGMQSDVPLVSTGSVAPEIIYLWDLDPIQGLGKLPYTNTGGSAFNGLVTTEPLAKTDDFIQFLLKSYTALCPSFESTSVWSRGWRIA